MDVRNDFPQEHMCVTVIVARFIHVSPSKGHHFVMASHAAPIQMVLGG